MQMKQFIPLPFIPLPKNFALSPCKNFPSSIAVGKFNLFPNLNPNPNMKFAFLFAVLTACLIDAARAGDTSSSSGVIQIDNEKVAAAFAKGGTLLDTNNYK